MLLSSMMIVITSFYYPLKIRFVRGAHQYGPKSINDETVPTLPDSSPIFLNVKIVKYLFIYFF